MPLRLPEDKSTTAVSVDEQIVIGVAEIIGKGNYYQSRSSGAPWESLDEEVKRSWVGAAMPDARAAIRAYLEARGQVGTNSDGTPL